ncbi:MAG: hypothetical protein APR53_08100 [Methanoculleus sp. SDB]|nr:MAG: hypothetical protein APR53_08100 [Methanoculleus sp. SDB]
MDRHAQWIGIVVFCLILAAGCLDESREDRTMNETEQAIAIALADPGVRENLPVHSDDYEIVDVAPATWQSTGPEGTVSGTYPVVTFRLCNRSSLYRVFVDVGNNSVVVAHWQWVKEPFPCMATGAPEEYATLEDAAEDPGFDCPLAVPSYLPAGYGFSVVRIYADPCPRREVVYTNRSARMLLVQTCAGDPPYAFAISMPEPRAVTANGVPATLVKGIGENQVSWTSGNATCWLRGSIDEEELLAVASSVGPFAPPSPPASLSEPGEAVTPGVSHFGTPRIFWPDEIRVKAGTSGTGEIVTESREKGYGRVHLRVLSRVTGRASAAAALPMPEEMEISIAPPDFMAYPHETYYAEITVNTTPATPPGDYVFRFHQIFEGSFYGGGWFVVNVTEEESGPSPGVSQ